MRLTNKKLLEKVKRKNRGNVLLIEAINQLIEDIETSDWPSIHFLLEKRNDADLVHRDGFFFFDIHAHRAMVLIEFKELEATVVWAGNHQEYEAIFKNNTNTIRSWLRSKGWI